MCSSTGTLNLFAFHAQRKRGFMTTKNRADKQGVRSIMAPIKVYLSPHGHRKIREKAEEVRLPISTFLREVGLGYKPLSKLDLGCLLALKKLRADLGRYGGLLKLWLTDQPNSSISDNEIREILNKADRVQGEIIELIYNLRQKL